MLGVALAFGVHLLNGAALSEFARAARGVNGQPDLVLRARTGALADADLAELLNRPEVAAANPVLEAVALWPGQSGPGGQALSIRLIGLDTLALLASAQQGQPLAPELMPQVDGSSRTRLGTGTVHLNAAARAHVAPGTTSRPVPAAEAAFDLAPRDEPHVRDRGEGAEVEEAGVRLGGGEGQRIYPGDRGR